MKVRLLAELLRQAQWYVQPRSPLWWAIERALEPSKANQ